MRVLSSFIGTSLFLGAAYSFQPNTGYALNRFSAACNNNISIFSAPSAHRSPLFHQTTLLATATSNTEDDVVEWTKPRLHNNPLVRSGVLLAALAATGLSAPFGKLPSVALASIHLLSFGIYFGTSFYTTFIAGLTMFKNLPRQTFGKLQSKLFPKYFALCSLTLVLQLITLSRLPRVTAAASRVLGLSLVMTLLNQFWLEPTSTEIMFSRYALENNDDPNVKDSSEYKKLAASFGKLHGISSLTNLIALVGSAVHGVYLASAMVGAL